MGTYSVESWPSLNEGSEKFLPCPGDSQALLGARQLGACPRTALVLVRQVAQQQESSKMSI